MKAGTVSVGFLHPGHWPACFGFSLTDLMFYDATHGQRITSHPWGQIANQCSAAQIHTGRNEVATSLLDQASSEWLWFVDSDMGFDADTVERLIVSAHHRDRPIVGGLCFAQKKERVAGQYAVRHRITPTIYTMAETEDRVGFVPMFDYPRDRLVQVDATGTACLLIHRNVLQSIRSQFGDVWFDHMVIPKGDRRVPLSEDFSFMLRAQACGFPVHVDTSVKTTHDKGGIFLDEEMYDVQQYVRASLPVEPDEL